MLVRRPARRRVPPARRSLRHIYVLRLPAVWWLLVGLVALTTAGAVHGLVSSAERARQSYGEQRTVVVVTRHVRAGDAVGADDVRVDRRPVALVPEGALGEVPAGRSARVDLLPGEVLVAERVAPDGLTGAAAMVPDGWRALAVPLDVAPVAPLQPGDRVDVLVTVLGSGDVASGDAPTVVVAEGALVLAVDELAATLAVPASRASRVAFGIVGGHVTLALRGA